tara:strand:+ start:9318 stop:10145 length:828 start_codon:yes stop_codon:yes gene_type:complete
MKIFKTYATFFGAVVLSLTACDINVALRDSNVVEDIQADVNFSDIDNPDSTIDAAEPAEDSKPDSNFLDVVIAVDLQDSETLEEVLSYPPGPYSLNKFHIVPNMTFYEPWKDEWIELGDFYKSEKVKALVIVSSAGWCGPCLMEAAALVSIYEEYAPDGLEIIYTLGNANIPGDVPFDTTHGDTNSAGFAADLYFMESWKHMAETEAGQAIPYSFYADPKREFLPYAPNHAWPFSILVTTKDMGIRLVEEGYWSALIENKINMVLYNEVPNLPFE